MGIYRGAGGTGNSTDDAVITEVQTYASQAATSATNAATSATNAADSATGASSSATTATTKAAQANSSATLAQGYASDALNSKNLALSYKNTTLGYMAAADSSANQASAHATDSLNSANSASSYADAAAASATSAASSATTATSSVAAAQALYGDANALQLAVNEAETYQLNSGISATLAASSATEAAESAAAAQANEDAASSWASTAQAASVSALAYSSSAQAARDATFAAYDSFDDRYLGVKSANPTEDNDGQPLLAGSLYFNDQTNMMMLYAAGNWVAAYTSGGSPSFGDTVVNGTLDVTGTITGNLTGNADTATTATNVSGGTASVTTLAASGEVTLSGGTANGVTYLNSSKVLTSGSALTFDGTNLGIGTSSPYVPLQVNGNVRIGTTNVGTDQNAAYAITTGGQLTIQANDGSTSDTSYWGFDLLSGTSTWQSGITLASNSTSTSQQFISFKTANTERMRLTSTGLGIGTSSPTGRLTLRGAAGTSGKNQGILLEYSNGTEYGAFGLNNSSGWPQLMARAGAGLTFHVNSDLLTTGEAMRIDTSGNLGLGVTPSAWNYPAFQVNRISVSSYSTGGGLSYNAFDSSTGWKYIASDYASHYQQNSGTHKWLTAPSGTAGTAITFTQAMTLDSSGNLGVGTTSPGGNSSNRVVKATGSTSSQFQAQGSATTITIYADGSQGILDVAGAYPLLFKTNNAERARIDSSGNLGLGVTPSAWFSNRKVAQIGGGVSLAGISGSAGLELRNNAYLNTGGSEVYLNSDYATLYASFSGQHRWYTAPSGTAGDAISFTQAMTLDASGNLGIGSTSPSTRLSLGGGIGQKLSVYDLAGVRSGFGVDMGGSSYELSIFAGYNGGNGQITFGGLDTGTNTYTERARITSTGTFQTQLDAEIYGVTVGRGAGAVSTNTAVGKEALSLNTTGDASVAVGYEALQSNTTGEQQVAVGFRALLSNTTGTLNTAVGRNALGANTTGVSNTALGTLALTSNTTASNNTAVGFQAGYSNQTGTSITAIGYGSLYSNTASNNTAVGVNAGNHNTTGSENTFIGRSAGDWNSTGAYNTALGYAALTNNTTASNNTAVGYQAGYSNTTGGITAFGYKAGYSNTTGDANIAIGQVSLSENTTGSFNTAIGVGAMADNISGSNNTAVGLSALRSGTASTQNVAVGEEALIQTTASNSVAVGYVAGARNISGVITAVGSYALNNNATGTGNTAVGTEALISNYTASNNTAVGYQAGYAATTGGYSTFLGYQSGLASNYNADAFANNTFVGALSGSTVTTGRKNTIIGLYNGNQGGLDIRTANNYIVLSDGDGNPRQIIDSDGNLLVGTTSILGTSPKLNVYFDGEYVWGQTIQSSRAYGTHLAIRNSNGLVGYISSTGSTTAYNTSSDYRLKENVQPMTGALAKVAALKPVTYTWKADGSAGEGFIAHELAEVVPQAVTGEKDTVDADGKPVYQGIDTSFLVATLTAALQEAVAEINSLKARLDAANL